MNGLDYEKHNSLSRQDLILLKMSALGCGCLLSIGLLVYAVANLQAISKADTKEQVKPGDGRRELTTPTQPSEAPAIITKKPDKPIIIEEGSEAYYCIQNNGGNDCLNRDRFAPNYRVIREKTYEDRLVDYGIRPINNCPPAIAWQPNCQY